MFLKKRGTLIQKRQDLFWDIASFEGMPRTMALDIVGGFLNIQSNQFEEKKHEKTWKKTIRLQGK